MIGNTQKAAVLELRNLMFSHGVTGCYFVSNGKITDVSKHLRNLMFSHGVTGCYFVSNDKITDVSKQLRSFNFRVKPSQEMGNVYMW